VYTRFIFRTKKSKAFPAAIVFETPLLKALCSGVWYCTEFHQNRTTNCGT